MSWSYKHSLKALHFHDQLHFYILINERRDGSIVKNTDCCSGGPRFKSQPNMQAHNLLEFQFRGICCSCLASACTRHAWGYRHVQTYIGLNTHIQKRGKPTKELKLEKQFHILLHTSVCLYSVLPLHQILPFLGLFSECYSHTYSVCVYVCVKASLLRSMTSSAMGQVYNNTYGFLLCSLFLLLILSASPSCFHLSNLFSKISGICGRISLLMCLNAGFYYVSSYWNIMHIQKTTQIRTSV